MMWRNPVIGSMILCVGGIVGLSATPTLSQGVWVGGGVRVRAPFVRVDVDPDGGVSVRAPFTAVDVPPRGYYYGPDVPPPYFERRIVEPQFPTAADLARMDDEQLIQALRAIAQSLHNRLSRFDTGDTWQRYLRLPEEAVDPSAPPDARTEAIAALLDRFQKIAADPQYPMIARLPAFTAMEAALNEALSRPKDETTEPQKYTEELPTPPQQQQLPPPQRPAGAGRDDPFLKPKPPQ
jgi:hypothetical protein